MNEDGEQGRTHGGAAGLSRGDLIRRGLGAAAGVAAFGAGGAEAWAALGRAGAPAADATKLTVWLAGLGGTAKKGTPLRKWDDDGVKRFTAAHPGTTVATTLEGGTIAQFLAQLRAAFAAHKTPDVMMLFAG